MPDPPSINVTITDGWIVTSIWQDIGTGRLEPVGVKVEHQDSRPVLADHLRRLPLGQILGAARRKVVRQTGWQLTGKE
jgi:hypothetical protein